MKLSWVYLHVKSKLNESGRPETYVLGITVGTTEHELKLNTDDDQRSVARKLRKLADKVENEV